MKLVIPCDWKNIDLLTTANANDFGEALRSLCFVGYGQQKGCYETFEVNKSFDQVTKGEIYKEVKEYLYQDITPMIYHLELKEEDCYIETYIEYGDRATNKFCEPYEIVFGWTWDGDGCLYFRFNDRKVVNSDCKKSIDWEWIK